MITIEKILKNYALMVLDGAFATELERRGLNIKDPLWSAKVLLEDPDVIGEVHYDYLQSGADCVITSSYQATIEGFTRRGLSQEEAYKLIQLSVHIAKNARDHFWSQERHRGNRPKPLVAASVGPYGAYLADGSEYLGEYTINENQLKEFHRLRMKALIEAEPDILACETIPCLSEARALATLLKEFPGTYAWMSFSAKDGEHISSGEKIAECAKVLDAYEQIVAIGVNCTSTEYIVELIAQIQKGTNKPIIVYPNSGEHYDVATKTWEGQIHCTSFAQNAIDWYNQGARIIGGCCRTSPKDIEEIAIWRQKKRASGTRFA